MFILLLFLCFLGEEKKMDLKALGLKIFSAIQKDPFGYQAYEDYYGIMRTLLPVEKGEAVAGLKWLSETISERMGMLVQRDLDLGRKMMGLHRRVLLAAAPWDFDSYMLFVEWNREPSKKFWPPRRRTLKPIADDMQALADDKLDLLAISQRKRRHTSFKRWQIQFLGKACNTFANNSLVPRNTPRRIKADKVIYIFRDGKFRINSWIFKQNSTG
jgi:hypothetical protein